MKRELQRFFVNKDLSEMVCRLWSWQPLYNDAKQRIAADKRFVKEMFDEEYDDEIDNAIGERLVIA